MIHSNTDILMLNVHTCLFYFFLCTDTYICQHGKYGEWAFKSPLCQIPSRSLAPRLHRGVHQTKPTQHALLRHGWLPQRPSALPPARGAGGKVHAGADTGTTPHDGTRPRQALCSPTPSTRWQLRNRGRGGSTPSHMQHASLPPLPSSSAQALQHGALPRKPANIWEH